jgi:hypothetical protein
MRLVTEILIRHGHYLDPEGPQGGSVVEWMIVDAERVLEGPLTYDGIAEALVDTGIHDPTDCNDACVQDLLETLV